MSAAAATAVVAVINHHTTAGSEKLKPRPSISIHPFAKKVLRVSRFYAPPNRTYDKHLTGVKFRRPFSPVMEWQDCTVKMEIDVPISVAYKCYSDREAIPQWMPFISSVKILEDKPDLSRWTLKYKAFGRDIEFSWLARNMQPIINQKIHWRSLEGLPNRGAVRFYPKGAGSCTVELTVSYEVPQLLTPVASALQPFLESLLVRGLERFAAFAKSYSTESTT
ncbi:Polyketide cyclase/dehydrase and lipid transport superfamily protein [Perilla frutescens var. hirtella]|nr:Polyketide cyclase/dehydrase and lipid transport superfamily protein [Perilla frutescens var. frutescens]KAH6787555.1 Polyketide cyclase/dehydrase and lipid transport superfamily protein [Perilla frutescens var. hirtella]